ncbi:MAG: 2-succinyl-5-enolpyruvyl-6-hydroxy-3-cyclohexene-1-carboxylic-acid synthase [Oscillochloridaceae bacterium umkhey_bin13]
MNGSNEVLTHWVATLVDELVRGGVHDFVICPGSRSTPLALAIARHPEATLWLQLDERSAGFFALGLARQRRRPAALLCTSGTAAANFLPAVAEADLARVPLIVLTADRPHELRDNGAPQTIDQVRLFGTRTRWFCDLPTPEANPDLLRYLRATMARALAASREAPAGPVHLNLPFREPLVPDRDLLEQLYARPINDPGGPTIRAGTAPRRLGPVEVTALAAQLRLSRHGLILCGPGCPPGLAPLVARLAADLGYPVLADPLSGVRSGTHDRSMILASYDAFLRDAAFAAAYVPDYVIRFGAMPTSKPLLQYLQRHPTAQTLVVDEGAGWREPTSLACAHLATDPLTLCVDLIELLEGAASPQDAPIPWADTWLTAEAATREVIMTALADQAELTEPGVFATLAELLPDGATLFVGNSMPVRDCDTFFPTGSRRVQIVGNRGANGIDGLVSTALGMTAAGARPLLLALGDLSLYHDANGLLAAKLHDLDATILLINNDGGGIFSFLPQASETDQFERLFGTPHGLDFAPLAAMYGARYTLASDWASLRSAVQAGLQGRGLHLVEVRTDRVQNVADHRALWPLVSTALRLAKLA